jgi:hypothetical protein
MLISALAFLSLSLPSLSYVDQVILQHEDTKTANWGTLRRFTDQVELGKVIDIAEVRIAMFFYVVSKAWY